MVEFVLKNRNHKGFTLIELLIVITLIGILAAVVISIINPEQKQNLARDGVSMSMMNKAVLSTESFISSYNRAPNEAEFLHNLDNIKVRELFGSECSFTFQPDYECLFLIDGAILNNVCDLSYWSGGQGDNQVCSFRYKGEIQGDPYRFRIYVRSMGLPEGMLVYDNKQGGKIYECPHTINDIDSLIDRCR